MRKGHRSGAKVFKAELLKTVGSSSEVYRHMHNVCILLVMIYLLFAELFGISQGPNRKQMALKLE